MSLWLGVESGPQPAAGDDRRVVEDVDERGVRVAAEAQLVEEGGAVHAQARLGGTEDQDGKSGDDPRVRRRPGCSMRPAGDAHRGEEHEHQRCHQEVAVDDRQARHPDEEERADADDEQRQRHEDASRGRRRSRGPGRAGRRRTGTLVARPRRNLIVADGTSDSGLRPAQLLGQPAGVLQREERLAGDREVQYDPHDGPDEGEHDERPPRAVRGCGAARRSGHSA